MSAARQWFTRHLGRRPHPSRRAEVRGHEIERDEPLAVIAEARLGKLADPWRGSRAVKGDAL
jgi:hypothetical protein